MINKKKFASEAIKFSFEEGGKEAGRAFLYIIKNDLHDRPYGLMEDVFVDEKFRGKGIGTKLVQAMIDEAKSRNCTKLIGTSRAEREQVHEWYENFGFKKWGTEFRMDF